ncbi:MAG: hypothetical protein K0S38_927 [Candidatus Paceibacter sp.]|jgi:hypothetical protein|nr:hypothetical protein [Candidatus Paceibacter sp.]
MKIFYGLFIIAHGLIHASYLTPKPEDPKYPFYFDRGWFGSAVGSMATPIGKILVVLTVIIFALAGLAIIGVPGLVNITKQLLVAGSIASLLVLVLYWHPWLILGVVIDIVLLYGVLNLGWLKS